MDRYVCMSCLTKTLCRLHFKMVNPDFPDPRSFYDALVSFPPENQLIA